MITFYYDNKFFVYLLYAYYAIFNVQVQLNTGNKIVWKHLLIQISII